MQLALSLDTCVPLAPQHDFPPAKDELAANTPAANNAKVVLIMHLRQHELRNVQCVASVIPSRGDDEGPRYVSGRCKLSFRYQRSFREVLACARDDAHCKDQGSYGSYVSRFRSRIPLASPGMTTST